MIPDTGEMTYGGVTFDALYHTTCNGVIEYDKAKRAVKYVRWTINLEGWIASDNGRVIDDEWVNIRQTLSEPGQTLIYTGKGFGPLIVNGDGPIKDVNWGPKPKIINFTPLGSGRGSKITWQVEFAIPECATAKFTNTLLAFNWGTSLTFDIDGYCKYAVTGELEIAQTYGSRANVESYRALTEPFLPIGFRTTHRNFGISDDKRTFAFSYEYEELPPQGIPFGATSAEGNYSVRNKGDKPVIAGDWMVNLSASFTIRPDFPRREAWLRFIGMLVGRMNQSRSGTAPRSGGLAPNVGLFAPNRQTVPGLDSSAILPGPADAYARSQGLLVSAATLNATAELQRRGQSALRSVIVRTFGFDEGLYLGSKRITFECGWTFICSFATLLRASGIWLKVKDCHPTLWQTSMAQVMGYRSWSFYQTLPNQDVVIDACSNIAAAGTTQQLADRAAGLAIASRRPQIAGATLQGRWQDPDNLKNVDAGVEIQGLCDPELSWMQYENSISTHLDPGMVLHKTLPQSLAQIDTLATVDAFAANAQGFTGIGKNGSGINTISKSRQSDYAVRASTSSYRVCLQGWGMRAGYQVPVPGLSKFGGVTPVPDKQWTSGQRIVANYSGIPIYVCGWRLWYYIPVPPTANQLPPPNLYQGIGGDAVPPANIPLPISVPEISPPPVDTTGGLAVGIVAGK